jgi:hypothetical protein
LVVRPPPQLCMPHLGLHRGVAGGSIGLRRPQTPRERCAGVRREAPGVARDAG